ncbi:putative late blight resistance protein homolog R1A-10 [Andrographis paniculata]|uniref:putative late blight resistance protein homolog R1A-10 n=1 Tax=Andrographis paniculata TaxID=175694 RepID=UPI0021E6DB32|nr:putative late blight resistance protein homolog R1A-10 [Andrographis paniculata]
MAVAAYASLVSLTHVLENVHYRAQLRRFCADIKQIETIKEIIISLLQFVEVHSERKDQRIEALLRQISKVGFEAEEIFDFHVINQLHRRTVEDQDDSGFVAFCEDLEGLIHKINFIKKELSMVEESPKDQYKKKQPKHYVPFRSSTILPHGRNTKVGLDEHVVAIKNKLISIKSNLQIIPIVGMGGIGKTTLARHLFEISYIKEHFDICIWLTISQNYSVDDILQGLLNNGEIKKEGKNWDDLGVILHKKLFGRRYLIVMDDVWSTQAWDDLCNFFPNNENGSRIIMTTRLSKVASCVGSDDPYYMAFLDEKKSSMLFCETVFAQESCPYPELEKIGKNIAKSCRGLPLEIVVIGSLLASVNMRREYWEFVADNLSALSNSEDEEHCLNILHLSYTHLPIHLKVCFLYMRVFDEDAEINISQLIKSWVAQGLIKASVDKSLEEIGEEYIKDLIGRNLIFIRERLNTSGKIISCGIHDLLRDLCLRESKKESFIHSPKEQRARAYYPNSKCFLCSEWIKTNGVSNLLKLALISPTTSQVNHLACSFCQEMYSHTTEIRSVSVMEAISYGSYYELVQSTQARYISVNLFLDDVKFVFPSMIYFLWNLQTLVIEVEEAHQVVLPREIWELPQLRHLDILYALFPDPGIEEDFFVLKNLQTISYMQNFKCTKEVLDRIPNIKKLGIHREFEPEGMELENYSLCNLVQLQKLESLLVEDYLENMIFPSSLKMLVLWNCRIPWENMTIVGSLPNLEVLQLENATEGLEWDPIEGEFLRLKGLHIECSDLVWWRADRIHFPKLEWLKLSSISSLEEIPLGIGDIPTLRSIDVYYCSDSAIRSLKELWEEQESLGNDSLQIFAYDKHLRRHQIGASGEAWRELKYEDFDS